ncbi:MAG: FKBP-type peptidyl-prolyl cis-trans isomerase, partial [Paludibacteraceae bacterium]|nr:FKBP-type peptidyl-prolyl cis-trans isomerase [Paludibacteraceae bacterium]
PNPTSLIKATYEGKLIDGTDFESQVDSYWDYLQNLPIGVQEILLKMHIGDIYEFYLPYTMAFGEKGDYKVPPYSTVIYRVELTDAKY